MRKSVAAGLISTAMLTLFIGPADAAPPADTAVTLPLAAAADVAFAGNHVFVSGGASSTDVVVTSAAGAVQRTISGFSGPTALQASGDGTTLYVAQKNSVAKVDVRTLTVIDTYQTGAAVCPKTLAVSGSYLYFGYACDDGQWTGGVGRINLPTKKAPVLNVTGTSYYVAPIVVARGSVLVAAEAGVSSGPVAAFTVAANGSLKKLSETTDVGGTPLDLALSADGSTLFTATGAPYSILEWGTAALGDLVATHPTTPYPNSVAVSPDGRFLVGGSNAYYDPDLWVFRNGLPDHSLELGGVLQASGLAWGANNTHLYAIATDSQSSAPVLHVINPTAG